jgi:hypothetical protein
MAIQTVVLTPGQCVVLPSSAEVIAVTPNGSITASSECDILPTPTNYKCWRFLWSDGTEGDPGYDNAYFTGIKIGDTIYNVLGAPASEVNTYDNGADYLAEVLPYSTPAGLVTEIVSGGGEAASPKCLAIQIPEIFGAPTLFWEDELGGGGIQYSAMFGVADICDCD